MYDQLSNWNGHNDRTSVNLLEDLLSGVALNAMETAWQILKTKTFI